MKKGSRLVKCHVCGCGIFWKIPNGHLLGIPLGKTKTVKDYRLRLNKYWCKECWDTYLKEHPEADK